MIVERGILVSEVGFTEGGGGRMHVQGAFVGHHASMSPLHQVGTVTDDDSWDIWDEG